MNFVDNRIDPGSGTIRARAVLPNPDHFITPGQFGRLRIPGSNPYEAILVPDSAIVTDQSNRIVMTVAEDGTVVPKLIRPGPSQPGGLQDRARGPDRRRADHHQRPGARQPGRQGDAGGRQDRARRPKLTQN